MRNNQINNGFIIELGRYEKKLKQRIKLSLKMIYNSHMLIKKYQGSKKRNKKITDFFKSHN
jgi:hypothetical protein